MRLLLILFLFPSVSFAGSFGSPAKGTSAADFLKLGAGARAAAMGEAFGAVAGDAGALYWNPAALVRVEERSATFMHAPYIDSSHFDHLAYAHKTGTDSALGAGLQFFSAGGITERDPSGAAVGRFTPWDLAFSFGGAFRFTDNDGTSPLNGFTVGLSGKFIRSKIKDSAQTFAADLGVLSPGYLNDRLNLAFTLTNMGSELNYERENEALPLALRLGGAYKLRERWLASMDVVLPRDNGPHAALGTEYVLSTGNTWNLAGRLGFNTRTLRDINGFTGFSMGLGIAHGRMGFDYAFVPLGSLSLTHRISLSYRFSAAKSSK